MFAATVIYLVYLAIPIILLIVGSLGDIWFNTLLPSGLTGKWYAQVATDGSFRRAFATSLVVCASTCALAAVIGVPLAAYVICVPMT